jgi:RNA polymerase sigma factor (sigma-70 family)
MAKPPDLLTCLRSLVDPARDDTRADNQLLTHWANNRDSRAFAALVWRHGGMVWRVGRGMLQSQEDAEDVFQATFLVLARRASALRCQPSLAGWLYGTAYRLALKTRTATARRLRRERAAAQKSPLDPLEELSVREARTILAEEFARLPAKYADAVVLCLYEGATQDEAARHLGCSLSTLKRRLERGRALLSERLSQRGLAPAGVLALTLCNASKAPGQIVQQTINAVEQLAAGHFLAGTAAALAGGVLRTVLLKKLAVCLAAVVLVGGMAISSGLVLSSTPAPARNAPIALLPKADAMVQPVTPKAVPRLLDIHGDPIPAGVVARIGSISLRPGLPAEGMQFTPDGKGLVTAYYDGFLYMWDAKTGKLRWRVEGQVDQRGLIFSSDSKRLAVSNHVEIKVLATDTGATMIQHLWPRGQGNERLCFATAPDLTMIAFGHEDGTVRLYDLENGQEIHRMNVRDKVGTQSPKAIEFSPDSKTIYVSVDNEPGIRVFDRATAKLLRRLDISPEIADDLLISPDGQLMATLSVAEGGIGRSPNRISLWDLATGKKRTVISRLAMCRAFSHDGKSLAIGSYDGTAVFDTNSGKEQRRLLCPGMTISLTFGPDGRTLAISQNGGGSISLWDVATEKIVPPTPEPPASVETLRFLRGDKQLLSIGSDRGIYWWDVSTTQLVRHLPPETPWSWWRKASPDGLLVASSVYKTDAKTIRDGAKSELVLLEGGTGRTLWSSNELDFYGPPAFSPDGTKLMCAGSRGIDESHIQIIDVASGKILHDLKDHTGRVKYVEVSPNGQLLASWATEDYPKNDFAIRLWEIATGKLLHRLTPRRGSAFMVAFSSDSSRLVTVGGEPSRNNDSGEVQLWDLATAKEVCSFSGHQERVVSVAMSPDGRMLATGSLDKTLRLWEVASGTERRRIAGHKRSVESVDFSSDSRLLAAASGDAPVYIWDIYGTPESHAALPKLSIADRQMLWQQTASNDAVMAFRAMCDMLARPDDAVGLLQEGWKSLPRATAKQVQQWIVDLNSEQFPVRKTATTELEGSADNHEELLRTAVAQAGSLEVKQRLEQVLGRLKFERLRRTRMVEVLERLATPQARQFMEQLAEQTEDASLSKEAVAALKRMGLR